MPTYAYAAVDTTGKSRNGTVEAPDQKAAIARVAAEGRYVTTISEQGATVTKVVHTDRKKNGQPSRADLALFTRRLSDLASSGLPLDRVLAVLAEQTENGNLSKAIEEALEDVRGGLPVSHALAKHPRYFPDVYSLTLRAGEASGQLPESAERLADLMEKEVGRRSLIVSALVYPIILSITAIGVVIFMITFVVPKLSVVFVGLGDQLPLPTKILLAVSGFLTNQWYIAVGAIVAIVVGARLYLSTDAGLMAKDQFLISAPLIGGVSKKAIVSRYARVLGTLVFGGVPILEALELSGMAAGNRVFLMTSREVEQEVRDGRSIAIAMKEAGTFPPVLTNMVAIGEETGDLSKMLDRVANSLDFEVETALRRLTASIEPIIVLVMGTFVAFIVLSVMLPIFQSQDLVK